MSQHDASLFPEAPLPVFTGARPSFARQQRNTSTASAVSDTMETAISPAMSDDGTGSGVSSKSWRAQNAPSPADSLHSDDDQSGIKAEGSVTDAGHPTGATDTPMPMPVHKRRRVTRACDECRRKKIKCDGKQPCTHCSVYSYGAYSLPAKELLSSCLPSLRLRLFPLLANSMQNAHTTSHRTGEETQHHSTLRRLKAAYSAQRRFSANLCPTSTWQTRLSTLLYNRSSTTASEHEPKWRDYRPARPSSSNSNSINSSKSNRTTSSSSAKPGRAKLGQTPKAKSSCR